MERIKPEYIGKGFTTKQHKKRVVVEDDKLLYDFYKAIGLGFIFESEEEEKPKRKRMSFPKNEPEVETEEAEESDND